MSINTPALAHETTTTTGTGSYTLLGAASALVRTFASAIAEGADAYVPYVCRSRTSADFEIGIGELSASTTLERTSIVESSNGNAAVNWAAGTKDIYVGNGATAPHGKHFLQANPTTPVYDEYPGATGFDSEITAGFGLGSLFQYFDGAAGDGGLHAAGLWLCAGPTGSAANLDWVYLSRHITPVYRTDATGTVRGGICLGGVAYAEGANSATAGGAVAIGDSAHVENHTSFYEGGPWDEGATPGESQTGSRTHGVRTTDDTPAECGAYGDIWLLGETQASLVTISVVAFDNATPNAAAWEAKALLYRQDAGAAVLVDTVTPTVVDATAGAAAWTVGVTASGNGVSITVTGAAATTIQWTARVVAVQAAVVAA